MDSLDFDTLDGKFITAAPENLGIKSAYIENAVNGLINRADYKTRLDGFLVMCKGRLIYERYFGEFDENSLHMLYSISKSFTCAAVGMLYDEGRIRLNDKAISFFKDISFSNLLCEKDKAFRDSITIRNLLTMSSGHHKTIDAMNMKETFEDTVKAYFDECPYYYEPGKDFFYDDGNIYILSAIIQKITGQSTFDFLYGRLFKKLDIKCKWEDRFGVSLGYSGLYVRPIDLIKFGKLLLNKGTWNGERILSEAWVNEAVSFQINNEAGEPDENSDWKHGYGYLIWRNKLADTFRCDGAFGQLIYIIPEKEIIIAVTEESDGLQSILDVLYDNLIYKILT